MAVFVAMKVVGKTNLKMEELQVKFLELVFLLSPNVQEQ
jgi:hypothetical protein